MELVPIEFTSTRVSAERECKELNEAGKAYRLDGVCYYNTFIYERIEIPIMKGWLEAIKSLFGLHK